MGDHRASIKIEFTMHEVTSTADMYINWWDGAAYELPDSVIEFFVEAERKSLSKFHEQQDEDDAEKRRRAELAELARLKAKYET